MEINALSRKHQLFVVNTTTFLTLWSFLASIGSYGGIPHFVYEVNVVDASDAVVGTGEPLDSN
jgi:hypothetical protein